MEPTSRTVKRLFALSQNRCAFPKCQVPIVEESGTVTGQICHIKARRQGGPRYDALQSDEERHSFENLILLCAVHSKIVDSEPKQYTVDRLHAMKASNEQRGTAELSQADANKVELLISRYRNLHISAGGHVMVASPGAVQASSVVIKSQRKSVILQPPAGSVASDLARRNYAKHLIDRYNDFAKQQPRRDLVSFLQGQIDATMIGSRPEPWQGHTKLFVFRRIRSQICRCWAVGNIKLVAAKKQKCARRMPSAFVLVHTRLYRSGSLGLSLRRFLRFSLLPHGFLRLRRELIAHRTRNCIHVNTMLACCG
jgi:hypothetical protein